LELTKKSPDGNRPPGWLGGGVRKKKDEESSSILLYVTEIKGKRKREGAPKGRLYSKTQYRSTADFTTISSKKGGH